MQAAANFLQTGAGEFCRRFEARQCLDRCASLFGHLVEFRGRLDRALDAIGKGIEGVGSHHPCERALDGLHGRLGHVGNGVHGPARDLLGLGQVRFEAGNVGLKADHEAGKVGHVRDGVMVWELRD